MNKILNAARFYVINLKLLSHIYEILTGLKLLLSDFLIDNYFA
ncbi:hypothetical protein CLU96_3354 [Chryseobacterium sp. 52]|nr:hypothetical protein CLU96_3354 [Chryseobacterium sp. 52]